MRRAAIVLLLVGVLSACGGSTTKAAPEKVIEGGTFRQGLVKLNTTDPAKAQSVSERVVASELYSTLTKWDQVKNIAIPELAKSWQLSDDKLHYTFNLDGDAKASNGEVVTAMDVKATIDRLADKDSGLSFAEYLQPVASINVVDAWTVRFDLSTPFTELPSLLANPAFGIVHTAGGQQFSTGDYTVASQTADAWTLKKAPGAAAHLDEIDVTFFADAHSAYQQFQAGKLDWVPVSSTDEKEAGDKFGTDLFKPSLRTVSLSFNLANPKLSDIRFREAIERAVERNAVSARLDVNAPVLNGVVPSGIAGEQAGGCGSLCFHDRQRAQSLVKDVFPNGAPPLTIDVALGSPFTEAATKQITDDLSQIGVTATIRSTPADKYGPLTVSPDREIFQTSWSAAFPTAGAFLGPLYESTSPSNVSGLKSKEVDDAMKDALGTISSDNRMNEYRDVETKVMSQLPVLPIAQFNSNSVAATRMHGIAINPLGTFDIENVWASAPAS